MIIRDWIAQAVKKLQPESGTAQLDAEVILAHVLRVDRAWLHAHPDSTLNIDQLKKLEEYLTHRVAHEPMAYILEKSEFYGREFYITSSVLVPRPESEAMIDLCKKYSQQLDAKNIIVVDVGTGSGSLAITTSLEINPDKTIAIDIDKKCLNVTKINSSEYNVSLELIEGSLAEPLLNTDFTKKDLVVLANLPYVPEDYPINSAAQHEPKHAIFGGKDGLELFRDMFSELEKIKCKSLAVFTESLPFQHEALAKIASAHGFNQKSEEDFIQVFSR